MKPENERAPLCRLCGHRHWNREPHVLGKGKAKPMSKKRKFKRKVLRVIAAYVTALDLLYGPNIVSWLGTFALAWWMAETGGGFVFYAFCGWTGTATHILMHGGRPVREKEGGSR